MIVVNFKTYSAASGSRAKELAERCAEAATETGKKVVVAPQPQDLLRLEDTDVEVFSQHVDPVEPGSHTGHVLAENVAAAGADGTLLNHSERRLEPGELENAVGRAKEAGLTTIVCAQDPGECGRYSRFDPDFIAYEPPELIGGDVSVSDAKPELIEKAVAESEVPALTGAGIHRREDVEKSLELGCQGVLVASSVVKSEEPGNEVKQLCRGL